MSEQNRIEAGGELDRLVAEKVFGIHQREYGCYCTMHESCEFCDGRKGIKSYSTDIRAAWEVAQKIIDVDDDHEFTIHLSHSKHQECEVAVRYWNRSDPDDPVLVGSFYILGKTAPHAICLAALKVVEGLGGV